MSELYTIDASVFVNAFNSYETGHKESHDLLERLQALRVSLIEPTLLLPELAATVSRIYQDEEMARGFTEGVRDLPNLSFVRLDESLAELTVNVAARHRLMNQVETPRSNSVMRQCSSEVLCSESR